MAQWWMTWHRSHDGWYGVVVKMHGMASWLLARKRNLQITFDLGLFCSHCTSVLATRQNVSNMPCWLIRKSVCALSHMNNSRLVGRNSVKQIVGGSCYTIVNLDRNEAIWHKAMVSRYSLSSILKQTCLQVYLVKYHERKKTWLDYRSLSPRYWVPGRQRFKWNSCLNKINLSE